MESYDVIEECILFAVNCHAWSSESKYSESSI